MPDKCTVLEFNVDACCLSFVPVFSRPKCSAAATASYRDVHSVDGARLPDALFRKQQRQLDG